MRNESGWCAAPIDSPVKGDVCGHTLPCPRHGSGKLAEAVAAHRERTSQLVAESLTEERCPAHGKTVAEHVDEYANDCTLPPPGDECPSCGTYGETGMHWDTCAYRGRNVRKGSPLTIPQTVMVGWDMGLPGAPRDPELRALAECVAALSALTPPTRARALRYLNARYEPSAVEPNWGNRSAG